MEKKQQKKTGQGNSGDDAKLCPGKCTKCTAFELARQTNSIFSLNMLFSALVPPDRFTWKALFSLLLWVSEPFPSSTMQVRGHLPLPCCPLRPLQMPCPASAHPRKLRLDPASRRCHYLHCILCMFVLVLFFLLKYTLTEGRISLWFTFGVSKQITQGLNTEHHTLNQGMNEWKLTRL